MMAKHSAWLLASLLIALGGAAASAVPITYQFAGHVENGWGPAGSGIGPGSSFAGDYIIESTTPDLNADPRYGAYRSDLGTLRFDSHIWPSTIGGYAAVVADPTNMLMLQYDSFRAGDWVITGWVQLRGSAHNPFSTDILPTWGLDPLDFSYHGFYITCNGAKLAGTIDQFTVIPEPGSAFSMVGTVLLVALMRSRNRTCCSL